VKLPVLFIVFNRPDTTRKVLEAISQYKPDQLFIAADGPRENNVSDEVNCESTRKIATHVSWNCEVKTLLRDTNLGCNQAVTSAIDWFFSNVEEGIILEDDCLPTQDFFGFCEALMERYRNDPKVMHITGGNYQFGAKVGNSSYYFSRIPHVWGWATWKRAWSQFDLRMGDFQEFKHSPSLKDYFYNSRSKNYWMYFFLRAYIGINTWDYVWTYTVMKTRGVCIIPNVNMISNIGFGKDATLAKDEKSIFSNMPTAPIQAINHREDLTVDEEADVNFLNNSSQISFLKRVTLLYWPGLFRLIYLWGKN